MKNRRALSSVVGTVFSIIALATVITYVTYSMNTLQQFNQEVMVKNTEMIEQGKEEFSIVKAQTTANNKFNITVQNLGNLPINVTRLWIQNKTDPNWGTYKYDVNTPVSPGEVATGIGQNLNLYAKNTQAYEIKLTTDRGNEDEVLINSPSQERLSMQLHAIPDTVSTDFTITLLFIVTNNMSNNNVLLNISPDPTDGVDSIEVTPTCASLCAATRLSGPVPSSIPSLKAGDMATFKWSYRITGANADTVKFTASLSNGYPGNTASATVTLRDVAFSIQSGTAVESQGLAATAAPDDTVILHQETTDALTGKQMYSGAGDNPITYSTSTTQNFVFFTKNDTQQNVVVDPGMWNATLRIVSNAVPDGLNSPNLIYHFNNQGGGVTSLSDSSGNNRDLTTVGGVSFSASAGRDTTGAYLFDGTSGYLQGPTPLSSGIDDIKGPSDSTSGWFKYTGTQDTAKKVIYRVGSDNTDYYDISIGDTTSGNAGKLIFKFNTASGMTPNPAGNCVQSQGSRVDDGQWHHFIAVRDGSYTCRLYIDQRDPQTTEIDSSGCSTGCGGTNPDFIDPAGRANIGRNPNGGAEFFKGYIDDIFHWNAYTFPQSKVGVFYNTNYGVNAHKFNFKYEKTKSDGSNAQLLGTDDTNYAITFWDGKGSATAWSGLQINYTKSLSSQTFAQTLDSYGDRLKFTMIWKSGLNMSIREDDPNLSNPRTTFIQIPEVSEAFPSYYTLDNDNNPVVNVYNQGPYGSWVTYLTRIALDDISSTNSYAGQVRKACGQTVDKNNQLALDSPLIKVGDTCALEFEKPSNPPNAQGTSPIVPPGQYRIYVFMSGYDEIGNIFLRTTYVGLVRVVE